MNMAKIVSSKKLKKTPNPNKTTDNILKDIISKCDANSNIIILFATLRPTLCFSSSIFRYHLEGFFFEQL